MQRDFQPTVYLLANRKNGAIYTRVTSNLIQRIHQHREGVFDGFTKQHAIKRLVWFEQHATMEHAIVREKRIKKWLRRWKMELIKEQPWLGRSGLGSGACAPRTDWVPPFAGMTKLEIETFDVCFRPIADVRHAALG